MEEGRIEKISKKRIDNWLFLLSGEYTYTLTEAEKILLRAELYSLRREYEKQNNPGQQYQQNL